MANKIRNSVETKARNIQEYWKEMANWIKDKCLEDPDITKPGFYKYIKKLYTQFHNEKYEPLGLDSKKYITKSWCKTCYGRGQVIYNGKKVFCRCAKITKEYTKELDEKRKKIKDGKEIVG